MSSTKNYRLVHVPSGIVIARKIRRAETIWQENVGLLGRKSLEQGEGIWLPKTSFVHTLGMRFTIDAIFLGSKGHAVKYAPNLRPGFLLCGSRRASSCVELSAGALGNVDGFSLGDPWLFEQVE